MKILTVLAAAAIGVAALASPLLGKQAINPNREYQLKSLKVVRLTAAGHKIDAWVMDSDQKDAEGMMFLTDGEVKSDQGMLFLFGTVQPGDRNHSFWMHNTLIALDIIYISAHKKVVSIAEGKPLDDTGLPAAGAYQYVVELKRGTAKRLGIKPGTQFDIPPGLKFIG